MKIIILILFTFIFANQVFSQNSDSVKIDSNNYNEDWDGANGCRLSPEIEPIIDYEKIKSLALEKAKTNKIQGKVAIQVLINTNSKITKTKILFSESKILSQAALDIIMNCNCYKSGFENKEPVSTWLTIPIEFKLK